MDTKIVFVLMAMLMVGKCTNTTLESGAEDLSADTFSVELKKKIQFTTVGHQTAENGGESSAAAAAAEQEEEEEENNNNNNNVTAAEATAAGGHRSARQFYSSFGYHQPSPSSSFVQRRAYKVPVKIRKKRPNAMGGGRMKPRGRPGGRPRRRPFPQQQQQQQPAMGRFRRLPPQVVRPQQHNFIDPVDYEDGAFESAVAPSYDYGGGDKDLVDDMPPNSMLYATGSRLPATAASLHKRPAAIYEEQASSMPAATAVIHVPVRVNRQPVVTTAAAAAPTAAALVVDPMEKLRQLVHEAMDEHFASRHRDLYSDGFDKQVFSAKYKRPSADKEKQTSSSSSAVADIIMGKQPSSSSLAAAAQHKGHGDAAATDVATDGSDDRLTLAEISSYMGAKPAETILSSGGHRYVLSDALQGYHHQRGGYVAPIEALLEVPLGRWAF